MNNKRGRTEFSFDSLNLELEKVEKDVQKISNIIGRIKDIKDIKEGEIEDLFFKAVDVAGKDSWKFLFETYSRYYNCRKAQNQKKIIKLIDKEVKKRLEPFITSNDINFTISSIVGDRQSVLTEKFFSEMKEFCKEKGVEQREILSYLYIALLIWTRENYRSNNVVVNIVLRKMFTLCAKGDKNDPLFVKSMKKAFFDGKVYEKFEELTYLYNGVDEELKKINSENISLKEINSSRLSEIEGLKKDISHLNIEITRKAQEIANNEAKINELESLIRKTDDRNEYNENLYKQQFVSLKRNFVHKLKTELRLEIEGLEDIAGSLGVTQSEKIHRRIDRIYKILQKEGE